jgi:OmpA-OmpF porin, OOP family
MRSNLTLGLAALAGLVGACTRPGDVPVCSPAASWSMPALRCISAAMAAEPPSPAPEPAPEPAALPPPPPPPPPRVEVVEDRINLGETVQFETNSAKLVSKSKTLLDEVAASLTEHSEITKVQIEGHTDSKAGKAYNQRLSEQRAAAVKVYLVSRGIAADRLTTKGFGEDRPVADNTTEEGRFKNRRVDFKILKRKR